MTPIESTNMVLPLLVTRALVVFPNMSEEIEVSRPFSVVAVEKAKRETNNLIFIVAQIEETIDSPTSEDIYHVGTMARIVSYSPFGEKIRIRVVGSKRAKLVDININENGCYATGELLESERGAREEEMRLSREVIDLVASSPAFSGSLPRSAVSAIRNGTAPEDLPDTLGSYFPFTVKQRQMLLEETDINKRLKLLVKFLNEAKEMAEVDNTINEKVRESSEKSQKEYYLREKMKAIKEELGEDPNSQHSPDAIKEKLEKNPYPENIKKRVLSELRRYDMMPESSLESSLIMNYIETLLAVPWFEKTEDNESLENCQNVLDEDHYGLEKVKKRIIEYLAVKKMTGNLKAPILCFYGPPGCGKTSLAKSIARALGRKFFKASLGGISDEAEIRGHRRTYVGSLPGRIIHGMTKCGTVNPVFLLDEIDKVGGSNYRGDPSSALLEVLDPEQNFAFNDNYLEEPYDLSNVLFICTANNISNVPGPLRDRLELIEVPSYTEIEKIKICEGFLVKKQREMNGLKPEDVDFQSDAFPEVIEHYTMESGVRQLERCIASLCRKAVVEILSKPDLVRPIKIDAEKAKEYLGVEIFEGTKREKEDQVGVVTGLAYTDFGGDILPIEVTYFPGKGGIVLTGKLGDVMKESATIAIDYVRANATKYGIDSKVFSENDIHIHVPEGAVPKDGPSAGVAMTVAVISCLSNKPVRADIGMTGEVTLRGKALAIGGLREKSLAAMRSGLKAIMIPNDNKKDAAELPKEVKEGLEIRYMKCVDDAVEFAFRKEAE